MLLTEETLKQLKSLIARIEMSVPYINATIDPRIMRTVEGSPEWCEIHKGRAGSSVNQLNVLLKDAQELKKILP